MPPKTEVEMSSTVSFFVIAGTLGSLLFFFLLLHLNKTGNVGKTTGHIYDGIEEYDNPLPSWWYWLFVLSIIYSLAYLAYYPGLGNFAGFGGWTSTGELEIAAEKADKRYGPIFAKYRDIPLDELAQNVSANKMGRRIFSNNCAVCHGATGEGSFGFPNLTDDEWIWGSENDAIKTTIMNGRDAVMPAWGPILGDSGVAEVGEYVLQIAGREVDVALAEKGAVHYQTYCLACHGPEGKGQVIFGAPDLTNEIWLYGNSKARIQHIIRNGRNGQMPAFEFKLGKD
jgi:cytochrome c oxidase cbb3-type subunit 3